ncbi:hypothetical protein SGLAM104S_05284 [Streptomyces glaucescens]
MCTSRRTPPDSPCRKVPPTPPSALIRDPSILKHTDGYYCLTYTTNWTGNDDRFRPEH